MGGHTLADSEGNSLAFASAAFVAMMRYQYVGTREHSRPVIRLKIVLLVIMCRCTALPPS